MKQELSASKVFSSMSVFDLLRDQLHMVFYCVTQSVAGKVSLDRVNDFLHDVSIINSVQLSLQNTESVSCSIDGAIGLFCREEPR